MLIARYLFPARTRVRAVSRARGTSRLVPRPRFRLLTSLLRPMRQ